MWDYKLSNSSLSAICPSYTINLIQSEQTMNPGSCHCTCLRPRPHVSGDFCIRKFFYADTKISASTRSVYESYTTVHTYPIRIRTSQRISQQSMRIKTGSDTVTSAYTKIYGYERCRPLTSHDVFMNLTFFSSYFT